MTGRWSKITLLLGVSAILASPALAQNLVPNPTFDTDLSGWDFIENETWNSDDADASAASGSAEMIVTGAVPATNGLLACVPLDASREYEFGAAVKLLSQGDASGDVRVALVWHAATECAAPANSAPTVLATASAADWTRLDGTVQVPTGAVAAEFLIQTRKLGGSEVSAITGRFDNAIVSPIECGDPLLTIASANRAMLNDASAVTASDALFMLRVAVGLETCSDCVCDVNGDRAVSATDALTVLNAAVGIPLTLQCPPCNE